jgi:hypothetical protein
MVGCLMKNELEIMWKETVVVYFGGLPRRFSGGTEQNKKKPQSW